jgi:UDP-N-acetylglucosamine acyltransferase
MSTHFHPSAILDPSCEIGPDVRIGPYAVVEANAVIGEGCRISAHAIICQGTRLGARNQVGYGAVLGGEPQDYAYKGGPSRVEIGSDNRIREYVTIHRASTENGATRVGNANFIMGGVHLGHDVEVGDRAILANNTLLGGYVKVGDGAFLGGATIVHQLTRIGTLAITRGGTRLGKDVPPYFMAVDTNEVSGTNRIGMRRAGFSHETRRAVQAAFDLLYKSNLNVTQALEQLERETHPAEMTHLIEFIRESKRGICRAQRNPSEDMEG